MIDDDELIARLRSLPHRTPSDFLSRRISALSGQHRQVQPLGWLLWRSLGDWQYRPELKIAGLALILAAGLATGWLSAPADPDMLGNLILGGFGAEG